MDVYNYPQAECLQKVPFFLKNSFYLLALGDFGFQLPIALRCFSRVLAVNK
jgi:hypothetical protein